MINLKTMAMEVAITSFFHKIIHEDNTYEIIAWKNSQIWVVLLIGWSKFQPIRSTTQIYVVSVHQYGILRSFLRRHFAGKPVMAWRNVGCFLRLTNSVNVVMVIRVFKLKERDWVFSFNFFGQNNGKPFWGTMKRSQGKSDNEFFHMNLWRQF